MSDEPDHEIYVSEESRISLDNPLSYLVWSAYELELNGKQKENQQTGTFNIDDSGKFIGFFYDARWIHEQSRPAYFVLEEGEISREQDLMIMRFFKQALPKTIYPDSESYVLAKLDDGDILGRYNGIWMPSNVDLQPPQFDLHEGEEGLEVKVSSIPQEARKAFVDLHHRCKRNEYP